MAWGAAVTMNVVAESWSLETWARVLVFGLECLMALYLCQLCSGYATMIEKIIRALLVCSNFFRAFTAPCAVAPGLLSNFSPKMKRS